MYTASTIFDNINTYIADLHFQHAPKNLYAPVEYVLGMGGKRIRPLLMLLAYNLYKEDIESIYDLAAGIEIYHNYTLLHDDLMDRADRRRGKKTVHKVWNDNVAILSGDAMLILAYQFIAKCPPAFFKETLDLFSKTALEICEGQQMDMDFEQEEVVKEAEYIEMIRLKTAVLLATSLKIGARIGGASLEDAISLYNFGIQIGLAFQLKDDLLDVYGSVNTFGKDIGGDILCNKKTFLLIKSLELADPTQLSQLRYWLEKDSSDPAIKIEAVTTLYDRIGIRAICEAKIAEYTNLAVKSLAAVNVADGRKNELKKIIEKLMYREM